VFVRAFNTDRQGQTDVRSIHARPGEVMYPHLEYRFLLLAGSLAIRHLPGSCV